MQATHVHQGILFEWDQNKAEANLKKHGIAFATACEVFFDPFLHIVDDDEVIAGELRQKVIGMTTKWRLIYIVYVMRQDRVRLISARPATNFEKKRYEHQ